MVARLVKQYAVYMALGIETCKFNSQNIFGFASLELELCNYLHLATSFKAAVTPERE